MIIHIKAPMATPKSVPLFSLLYLLKCGTRQWRVK